MPAVKETELIRSGADTAEVVRLRRELAEAKTRLEEESAYFRAELEATRQRVEKQYVREHAEELVKRRRAEEQGLALKAELRQTQAEAESARERCEDLARQLLQLQEAARRHTQDEVEKVRAAGKAAWQSAEEEIARAEQEHAATQRVLAQELARSRELEATISKLRSEKRVVAAPDPDTLRLIASLKKALWATAQARRRAEVQLAVLQAGGASAETRATEPAQAVQPAFQQPQTVPAPPARDDGLYNELNLDDLKSLTFGDMNDDLADDFMLVPGDTSLDDDTFEKLETLPEPVPIVAAPPSSAKRMPERTAQPKPRTEVMQAYETVAGKRSEDANWVDRSRHGLGRVIRNLILGGVMTAGGYWLLESGILAELLK